jgi:hypothetical protein
MEDTTNQPKSPQDEPSGASPHAAGAEDAPAQPQSPAEGGSQAAEDATSARQDTHPHEPELNALIDAAVVLLSGWATLGLRVSKLVLHEGARSLEHAAQLLQSLAAVIEKKIETPPDRGSSSI